MCFELTNAPATFQRLMETVLKGILWKICVVYMDDVICYADKFQTVYNNKTFDRNDSRSNHDRKFFIIALQAMIIVFTINFFKTF